MYFEKIINMLNNLILVNSLSLKNIIIEKNYIINFSLNWNKETYNRKMFK